MLYPAELREHPRRGEDSLPPAKCEEAPAASTTLPARRAPSATKGSRPIPARAALLATAFLASLATLAAPAGSFAAAPAATPAAAPSAPRDTCPSAGTEDAVAAAIIDATTLALTAGAPVRLAGIDVPDPAATAALVALVPAGAALRLALTAEGQPDRYGRRHAFVFLADGRLLQSALVEEGAARARWLPGDSACFATLLAAEKPARRAHTGLWAAPEAILAADDPSLVSRAGLYEVVAGRLISVGHGASVTFLDFGRNHRRDFTVMLSGALVKALTATLGSVDALVGRQLLVRGVIQNNRGAAMRLNDAAEIELFDDPLAP